jgi:hypothetical protein
MLQSNLLRGGRVQLTAVTPADLPTLTQWWANTGFLRPYDSVPAYPRTESQLAKRIEEGQKGGYDVFVWDTAVKPCSLSSILPSAN